MRGGCFVPIVFLFVVCPASAPACSCVAFASAQEAMREVSVVFRGTAVESKVLPQHPDMRWRRRYVVTFQVRQFWKGDPKRTVTLYDLEPGTDCLGAGFEAGHEYLVYAVLREAKDYKLDDLFWFGWTDILAPGTTMLEPLVACMPGGEIVFRKVRRALRQLGRGQLPSKD